MCWSVSFPALQLLLRCLSQRRDVSWLAVWGHIWCLTHEKRIVFLKKESEEHQTLATNPDKAAYLEVMTATPWCYLLLMRHMTWIWATYCQVSKGVDNIGENHLKWKFFCRWTMRIRSWNQQWTHLYFATIVTVAMTNNCRFCCSNNWTKRWMVLALQWLLATPPAALLSDMGCSCSRSKIHHPEVQIHLYSTHSCF